jgi:hypothetical protein
MHQVRNGAREGAQQRIEGRACELGPGALESAKDGDPPDLMDEPGHEGLFAIEPGAAGNGVGGGADSDAKAPAFRGRLAYAAALELEHFPERKGQHQVLGGTKAQALHGREGAAHARAVGKGYGVRHVKEAPGDGAIGLGDIRHFLKINVGIFGPFSNAEGHRGHGGEPERAGVKIGEEPLDHQGFDGGRGEAGAAPSVLKGFRG